MGIAKKWQKFKAMSCFFAKKQNPAFAVYDYLHKKMKYGIHADVYFKLGLGSIPFANLHRMFLMTNMWILLKIK